ncbi:MAG: helix-turn-helix transcriptional regulator [Saprospiraceae bacterium]|nr:helix-turn-helix transcriptional regulator [Saprospiraceae bacterium]
MSKARLLLLSTDDPIANIAFDTGFNDPDYFSRAFHKEFGLTPTEFRAGA